MNEGDAFLAQCDEGDACMPELVDESDDDEETLGPVRLYGEVLSSFHVENFNQSTMSKRATEALMKS